MIGLLSKALRPNEALQFQQDSYLVGQLIYGVKQLLIWQHFELSYMGAYVLVCFDKITLLTALAHKKGTKKIS